MPRPPHRDEHGALCTKRNTISQAGKPPETSSQSGQPDKCPQHWRFQHGVLTCHACYIEVSMELR
eukprot:1450165-Pyramimonas_sp.AAC.1